METFVPVAPVSSGTEIHTFLNSDGALDLYTVGSDAAVHRLRRGQGTGAPYEDTAFGITASQLYLFTATEANPDRPSIFGLDSTGKLSLSTWHDGIGYLQRTTQPEKASEIIRSFLGVRGSTGRIYVNVRLADGSLGTNYFDPSSGRWGGKVWAPVDGPDGKPAKVKDITVVSNNPVQSALFAVDMADELLFAEDSYRTSQLRKLGKKVSHVTVVTDPADRLYVFAVELGTGLLWLKRQHKHSAKGIQFEDWVQVDPYQQGKLATLRANVRFDDLVEVFALDSITGDLWYSRQTLDDKGEPSGWTALFPIRGSVSGALFATGRTASGYSEAYSVTRESQVCRFWQSPESGQWFSDKVEVPDVADTLVSVPTHATEIVVVDDKGLALPDADVVINTAFLTTLWVNGAAYRASLVDPVRLKTGANGKIVLHQRANALAGASLIIQTPQTKAGAPALVEPNAQLQHRFTQVTKKQILDAKDASNNFLLPKDENAKKRDQVAESIAQITKRSMEIAQADKLATPVHYQFAAARHPGFQPRLNLAAMQDTAWEIDFSAGYPKYQDMTIAQAQAYRADRVAGAAELGGVFGIDWGSVWSAVRDGVEWVVKGITKIVVSIVDGIARVIFEIAGKVFEAVLEFVQQAFDFIEGVWNWLKVKLQQLYEWLAFLFNLKDFARTADGIKHTIGVMLDFTAYAVHQARDQISNGFDVIKGRLTEIVDGLVEELNGEGDPTIGNYCERYQPNDDQAHAADHNIFVNAFVENQHRIKVVGDGTAALDSMAADDPLAVLMNKLKQLSENFQFGDGKTAFDEALGYFDNVGKDRSRAPQLLLSGLVKALEGVALFALDFAKGVVLTIFDLFEDIIHLVRAALFARWEIPIVSQLYRLFTGKGLTITPVDVAAWVVAIPATIFSKVVVGRSPWPDDEDLKRFERSFTVDMLKRRMGLVAAGDALPVGDWDPQWRTNLLSLFCGTMFVRAIMEPRQVVLHSQGESLGDASIVAIALRFMTTGFTAPWALSSKPGGPGCQPGKPDFAVTNWICQMVCGPVIGFIIFIQTWVKGQAKTYVSEIRLTLWGAANLVMAAVNFASGPQTTASKLAFSRAMLVIIPGQTLRFASLQVVNKPYPIPVGVLANLIPLAYIGSIGVAIAEIAQD
ncbi:MAG: hypothetical protein ACRDRX_02755 [Pseudonocardiaceae bacterium]